MAEEKANEKDKAPVMETAERTVDSYADAINIFYDVYGFTLQFGCRIPGSKKIHEVTRIRISPQMAFVLTQLLRENVRFYKEHIADFSVPADMMQELGIDEVL